MDEVNTIPLLEKIFCRCCGEYVFANDVAKMINGMCVCKRCDDSRSDESLEGWGGLPAFKQGSGVWLEE